MEAVPPPAILSPTEILDTINLVIAEFKKWRAKKTYFGYDQMQFKKAMFEKYTIVAESAPSLFNKAVVGDFEKPAERERLQFIISMTKKVKQLNQMDNYEEVSKEVNHKFSTDFKIYDLVNKLEKERLEKESGVLNDEASAD